MSHAGGSPGAKPPTRAGILRKILIIDRDEFWGSSMSLALEETGYYLNWLREPGEGRRRVLERVYDLVVVSDSLGEPAVASILEAAARLARPPAVVLVAAPETMKGPRLPATLPRLSIVRRPCRVEEVVDGAWKLIGAPWTDRLRGA